MREIKFRAWNLDHKWMDDFFFVSSSGIAHDTPSKTYDTPNTEIEENPSLILMQFTGLKDKRGVDIYFDDVVYIAGYGDLQVEDLGDLMILVDATMENDVGGILGNIHENPELLEANK